MLPILINTYTYSPDMDGRTQRRDINKKDDQSIVYAIKTLDGDRSLLQRLSINARNTILTEFSPEAYIGRLNELY